MSILTRKIISGQSTVSLSGDFYRKKYLNINDYYQEKWAITHIKKINPTILPSFVEFDDFNSVLTTSSAGLTLESAFSNNISINIFVQIIESMLPVWNTSIKSDFNYLYKSKDFSVYVTDFLDTEYKRILESKKVPEKYIRKACSYMKESVFRVVSYQKQVRLIHFDLSPRNILIHNEQLKIIDWTRSIQGYVIFDLGIMFSKFNFHNSLYSDLVATEIIKLGFNYTDVVAIAIVFDIYRKAKKINTFDDRDFLINLIENLS